MGPHQTQCQEQSPCRCPVPPLPRAASLHSPQRMRSLAVTRAAFAVLNGNHSGSCKYCPTDGGRLYWNIRGVTGLQVQEKTFGYCRRYGSVLHELVGKIGSAGCLSITREPLDSLTTRVQHMITLFPSPFW